MSVKPVTYYDVACDEPDCKVDTGYDGEYTAWSDEAGALEDWTNQDGIILDDGRTFCEKHGDQYLCRECGGISATVREVGGGPRRICAECRDAERQPDQPRDLGVESLIGPHDRPLPIDMPGGAA